MYILSKFKFLRGTFLDPFGKTLERKMERQLINDYEYKVEKLLEGLSKKNYKLAIEIAKIPEQIRGYDLVKHNSLNSAKKHEKELFNEFFKTTSHVKNKNSQVSV